ncbi:hypothetical protein ACIBEJ_25220 [Nonomuraea sp. NPDC050790]|uniref:hypothetical protein n=1 Tax=Nonomuraea sp. NPDC050790 TaxID=3364371 RepID=UPI00378F1589
MTDGVQERSTRTITQAITTFKTFDWDQWSFPSLRIATGKTRTDGGSGEQSFLEGLQYKIKDKWYNGHISLSPMGDSDESFYFSSAHLTITGGTHNGNYFFTVNETEVKPSDAPSKFKGKYSYSGNDLPDAELRADIVKLLELLALFGDD